MVPERITRYLNAQGVRFERIVHPRAVSAQKLAQSLHESGHQVAKTVVVRVDGRPWLAVLAASEIIEPILLGAALGARHVELADETSLAGMFPDCELGAEPPFGHLYGMPVIIDAPLDRQERLLVRAGSHEEVLVLSARDLVRLERPLVASFGVSPESAHAAQSELHP